MQENPDIELSPDEISFTATGIGAHGKSTYEFKLEPYGLISPIVCHEYIIADLAKEQSLYYDTLVIFEIEVKDEDIW